MTETYRILVDDRRLVVYVDMRTFTVVFENRRSIVEAEPRVCRVHPDRRLHRIGASA